LYNPSDMQTEYILLNDQLMPIDLPVLKTGNRAFKYGDGLFESMRMSNGQLNFADLHAERLSSGMKAIKMDSSTLIDEYFIKHKTAELAKKNRFKDNVRFRLTVFREGEGLYMPESNKFGYLLEASPLTESEYTLNKKGLIIDVYDDITKPVNILSGFKTTSSLLYVMAGLYKKQHKLDEALIINQHGFLCESMSSNVFVVYEKQIYTPALSEGCVAGVMRKVVIKLAQANNIPIIEAQINPEILNEAEEVFVTNATSGIRWVMGFGKKRYFNEMSKTLSTLLNRL
jgi:branched-chain amino acid aminotransferase